MIWKKENLTQELSEISDLIDGLKIKKRHLNIQKIQPFLRNMSKPGFLSAWENLPYTLSYYLYIKYSSFKNLWCF